MIKSLDQPASVTGRRWDLLAWNAAAVDVFDDFGQLPEEDCNILVFMLTAPHARCLFGDTWTTEAKRMVSQFRAAHHLWEGAPAFLELSRRFQLDCPEFSAWWETRDMRTVQSGQKHLNHPSRGPLHFKHSPTSILATVSQRPDAPRRVAATTALPRMPQDVFGDA